MLVCVLGNAFYNNPSLSRFEPFGAFSWGIKLFNVFIEHLANCIILFYLSGG